MVTLINKENLLVPSEYLTSYMASAHIGVIQQWLNNGQKETPEEIARFLSTIAVHNLLCGWFKEISQLYNKKSIHYNSGCSLLNTSIYPSVPCIRIR